MTEARLKYVVAENGCWNWTGSLNNCGYGRFSFRENGKKRGMNAHRAAYKILVKSDIGNIFVLHKCDNRKCINPEHLFLGTAKDNAVDRDSKGRDAVTSGTFVSHNKGNHEGSVLDKRGMWCREVSCSWCDKKILRTPTELRRFKNPFCSHACYIYFRSKKERA